MCMKPLSVQSLIFGLLQRQDISTTAVNPDMQYVAPMLFNAEWDLMSNDEVATGTRVET